MYSGDKILTAVEVAIILKVSKWSIYEMVKINQIPHFKVGRNVRFHIDDLRNWIKENPD